MNGEGISLMKWFLKEENFQNLEGFSIVLSESKLNDLWQMFRKNEIYFRIL